MTRTELILAARIRRLEAILRSLKRLIIQATAEQDSCLDLEPDFSWLEANETAPACPQEGAKLVLRPQQQVDAAVPDKRR